LKEFLRRDYPVLILVMVFVLFKWQDLSVPYFGDEAWSYIPAIKAMASSGPSILPGSIDPVLYRGHPMLFYFLGSLWMKLFGGGLMIMNLLPLIITVILIYSTYQLGRQLSGIPAAIIASFGLSVQSIVLAQSSFVLPEMLLALWTVLAFLSLFKGNILGLSVWLSLALLTKETAIVLFIAMFIAVVLLKLNLIRTVHSKKVFLWPFLIPIVVITGFYILQRQMVGWYFFPNHMRLIETNGLLDKVNGLVDYLLFQNARWIWTSLGLVSLVVSIVKRRFDKRLGSYVLILLIFSVGYLVFSSMNFYTTRYLLSIFPLLFILWGSLINKIGLRPKTLYVLAGVIIIVSTQVNISKRTHGEDNLGYRDVVRSHQLLVNECEEMNLHDAHISAQFLMRYNMSKPFLGYLQGEEKFKFLDKVVGEETKYILITSLDEGRHHIPDNLKALNPNLLYREEVGMAWVELYELPQ
jgi:4-amino-4-deoxy-L-arabinose transferase-like glycosyltransferase